MKATGWIAVFLAAAWGQAQTSIDLRTQAKNIDFSAAASTRPVKTGSSLPAVCAVGELFFLSSGAPGDNVYGCTAVNTWTRQSVTGGLPEMSGQADKLLSTDGSSAAWIAPGGDLNGTPSAMTVTRIQGRAVAATAPAEGQALVWSAGSSQWQPAVTPGLPAMSGQTNKLLSTDGSSAVWVAPGGDLSGTPLAMTVTRIQGRAVAATAPAEGGGGLGWNPPSDRVQKDFILNPGGDSNAPGESCPHRRRDP